LLSSALSAFSRLRSFFVSVAALALLVGVLAFSSNSAQAAELTITPDESSYTVTYPNSPTISLKVTSGTGTVPDGGQISLTANERIYAIGTVSNGQAILKPIDEDYGYLPIDTYNFVAHYGDDSSGAIPVTVKPGELNFGFTEVTDNNNGTADFSYAIAAKGTQTNDTRPSGIVFLQRAEEDIEDRWKFVPSDDALVFTGVPFDDGVEYRLHWLGSTEYPEAYSAPFVKGGTLPTTTTTTSTSTTTSTVPTTTTTTSTSTTTTSSTTSTSTTTSTTSSTSSTTQPSTPSNTTSPTVKPSEPSEPAPAPRTEGYRLVESDGTVRSYVVQNYGDASKLKLNSPIISASATASNEGYWLLGADGGIFSFGDAKFFGSMGGKPLNQPVVGLAPTPSGNGYWLVASDGGVFAYGDAGFFGSMGGKPLNKPIVGITAATDGQGYRMVASDGGIFSFGSAQFYGSMGGKQLNKPVVGMTATPDGNGYWLVASDGGIFAYGNAGFYGSTGNITLNQPIVAMRSTGTGAGYWFVASDGGVFAYGDAKYSGSAAGVGKGTATVALS
jgi:hypothetical protein